MCQWLYMNQRHMIFWGPIRNSCEHNTDTYVDVANLLAVTCLPADAALESLSNALTNKT